MRFDCLTLQYLDSSERDTISIHMLFVQMLAVSPEDFPVTFALKLRSDGSLSAHYIVKRLSAAIVAMGHGGKCRFCPFDVVKSHQLSVVVIAEQEVVAVFGVS